MDALLPKRLWALTPHFHPYQPNRFGGIFLFVFLFLPFVSALRKSTARQGDVFVIRPLLGLSAFLCLWQGGGEEGGERQKARRGVPLGICLTLLLCFFLPIYFYILLTKLNDPQLLLVIFLLLGFSSCPDEQNMYIIS